MSDKAKYIDAMAVYIRDKMYAYQKRWLGDRSRFRMVNKSRQIGYSYVVGLDVLIGVLMRERNQLVVSSSLDNATIIGDYVREHLVALNIPVEKDSADRIEFMNGKKIRFLATNWRTARGFNGDIWFDEYAFTLQDTKIWTALVPSVTAVGGRISVISTPKSRIDKFWQLWEKQNSFSKHLTTIHDAVADGFPVNIEELRELFSVEEFAQAYECLPLDTSDSFISYDLIEQCIDLELIAVPHCPGQYYRCGEGDSFRDALGEPISMYFGADIGRTRDETAILGGSRKEDEVMDIRYITEMKKASFGDQRERLNQLCRMEQTERLAIDRGGIGMNLHEDMQMQYPAKVRGYNFAPAVKERLAKGLKRAFEERKIRIPNHPILIQQILSVKRSANKTNIFSYDTEDKTHHADKFWALAMCVDCSRNSRIIDYVGVF